MYHGNDNGSRLANTMLVASRRHHCPLCKRLLFFESSPSFVFFSFFFFPFNEPPPTSGVILLGKWAMGLSRDTTAKASGRLHRESGYITSGWFNGLGQARVTTSSLIYTHTVSLSTS